VIAKSCGRIDTNKKLDVVAQIRRVDTKKR